MQLSVKNGITCLFILLGFHGFAQTDSTKTAGNQKINQFDAQGRREGVWKKYYKNEKKDKEQLRYQGQFEHGRETGTFKFYKPTSGDQPAATKTYSPNNDTVVMKFFSKKGFLISKGKLIGKQRVGEWNYYQKNAKHQKIMTEHYKNGKLNGLKIVYFNNGQITEKQNYQNDLKEGDDFIYSKNGTLLQHYRYEKDTLQGESKTYDADGNLKSEGKYKKGMRDGVWKFYENDSLIKTQKYPLERRIKNIEKKKD